MSPYTPPPIPEDVCYPRPSSPYIPVLPPTPESNLGKSVGNFTLVSVLGQGGMGTVYVGQHATMERRVAIKTLKPELAHDPQLVARFFREAQLLSHLRHPGIVDIYDSGTCPDVGSYLIMEYLEGETLQEYMRHEGALPPRQAIGLVCQILDVLVAVHGAGVLHRDLKPSNIYLVKEERTLRVKILDFGISKFLESSPDGLQTMTGYIVGTPAYLSPEQAIGRKNITAASDLYAVGTLLFEMVTGRRPFVARTPQKLLLMQQTEPPPPPSSLVSGLPAGLEDLILQCLEKLPERRPQSAKALSLSLHALLASGGDPEALLPFIETLRIPHS